MIVRRASVLPWEYALIKTAPKENGLYILRDELNSIVYIGVATGATTLEKKLLSHYKNGDLTEVRYFDWYLVNKASLIGALKKNWDKRYLNC